MCAPYPSWPELLGMDQRGVLLTCNDCAVSLALLWVCHVGKVAGKRRETLQRRPQVKPLSTGGHSGRLVCSRLGNQTPGIVV